MLVNNTSSNDENNEDDDDTRWKANTLHFQCDELSAPPSWGHNISGFIPAKSQNNTQNSTTPFQRFISAYYAQ